MTIASEITRIRNGVASAYTSVQTKGGTLPATQNLSNLPSAIESIPAGGTSTLITKTITQNGTYSASSDNADGYSSVTVNISSGGDYAEFPSYQVVNGVAIRRSGTLTGNEFSNITSVGPSGLYYGFSNCTGLIGNLDLSSLTSVSTYGLYYGFSSCVRLTSVDLSSLTSIDNVGMAYAFVGCTSLENIYFNSLTTASFGKYTNQFQNLLYLTGTSVTHTLHFPSNLESTISGLDGYPNFGGTSGYVVCAFDLPETS